jgi:hypothetical protein
METAPATAFMVTETGQRSLAYGLFELQIAALDSPT